MTGGTNGGNGPRDTTRDMARDMAGDTAGNEGGDESGDGAVLGTASTQTRALQAGQPAPTPIAAVRGIGFVPAPVALPRAASTVSAADLRSWERVCAKLKAKLGDDVFSSWFGRARLDGVSTGHVSLSVPTGFLRSWIRTHYVRDLLAFWREERADILRIEVSVRSAARNVEEPPVPAGPAPARTPADRAVRVEPAGERAANGAAAVERAAAPAEPVAPAVGFDGSPLDPRLTFANLVEGRANTMALAAARSVVDPVPGAPRFNPLFVHAAVGLGKTHLLQAIAHSVKEGRPADTGAGTGLGPGAGRAPKKILYLTAEYFMWRFASAIRDGGALSFKESLRDIDLLLIDDMQFLQGKTIQQEFCHLLNALIDSAKQVVIAADRPPVELESLDARVKSRLQGGVAVEVKSPEYEMRRSILDHRLREEARRDPSLDIPANILDHIADNVTGSARDLEGAFNQMLMQHRFASGPLTMERVDTMLAHLVQSSEPKRVRIEDIQKVVGRHYAVSRNDLLSNRRTQVIVRPRQIAMYLSKTLTPRSLPEIGRRFGGRDHTTVLHAVRKIERLLGEDTKLAQEIELLKRLVQEI